MAPPKGDRKKRDSTTTAAAAKGKGHGEPPKKPKRWARRVLGAANLANLVGKEDGESVALEMVDLVVGAAVDIVHAKEVEARSRVFAAVACCRELWAVLGLVPPLCGRDAPAATIAADDPPLNHPVDRWASRFVPRHLGSSSSHETLAATTMMTATATPAGRPVTAAMMRMGAASTSSSLSRGEGGSSSSSSSSSPSLTRRPSTAGSGYRVVAAARGPRPSLASQRAESSRSFVSTAVSRTSSGWPRRHHRRPSEGEGEGEEEDPAREARLRELFDRADLRGRGFLTLDEILAYLTMQARVVPATNRTKAGLKVAVMDAVMDAVGLREQEGLDFEAFCVVVDHLERTDPKLWKADRFAVFEVVPAHRRRKKKAASSNDDDEEEEDPEAAGRRDAETLTRILEARAAAAEEAERAGDKEEQRKTVAFEGDAIHEAQTRKPRPFDEGGFFAGKTPRFWVKPLVDELEQIDAEGKKKKRRPATAIMSRTAKHHRPKVVVVDPSRGLSRPVTAPARLREPPPGVAQGSLINDRRFVLQRGVTVIERPEVAASSPSKKHSNSIAAAGGGASNKEEKKKKKKPLRPIREDAPSHQSVASVGSSSARATATTKGVLRKSGGAWPRDPKHLSRAEFEALKEDAVEAQMARARSAPALGAQPAQPGGGLFFPLFDDDDDDGGAAGDARPETPGSPGSGRPRTSHSMRSSIARSSITTRRLGPKHGAIHFEADLDVIRELLSLGDTSVLFDKDNDNNNKNKDQGGGDGVAPPALFLLGGRPLVVADPPSPSSFELSEADRAVLEDLDDHERSALREIQLGDTVGDAGNNRPRTARSPIPRHAHAANIKHTRRRGSPHIHDTPLRSSKSHPLLANPLAYHDDAEYQPFQ